MNIVLREKPQIAPRGKNMGAFHEIKTSIVKDAAGKDRNVLTVVVNLDTLDQSGKPYEVAKEYNLSGHGLRAFSKDFESWAGRRLTDQEIDDFDDALLKGKRVLVETDYRKEGKKIVPTVVKFLPPEQPV